MVLNQDIFVLVDYVDATTVDDGFLMGNDDLIINLNNSTLIISQTLMMIILTMQCLTILMVPNDG